MNRIEFEMDLPEWGRVSIDAAVYIGAYTDPQLPDIHGVVVSTDDEDLALCDLDQSGIAMVTQAIQERVAEERPAELELLRAYAAGSRENADYDNWVECQLL